MEVMFGRRFFSLLFVVWLMVPGFSAADGTPYPPDIEKIMQEKILRVAMYHDDSPPFYFNNAQGQMDGIDVCLIWGLAKRMGVEVEFNREGKSFEEVIDRLTRHQADVAIAKLSKTFFRSMRVRFSVPYLHLHQALLVNRLTLIRQHGSEELSDDFSGRLAVLAGSSYVEKANSRFNRADIVAMDDWNEMVAAVIDGSVAAIFRDEVMIGQVLRERPQTGLSLKKVILPEANDSIVVVLPWDSGQLLETVNFYLQSLNLDINGDKILKDPDGVLKMVREKTKCP
ncbi:MAG: arginine transport system substrate-binding protein [Magnetococcales bacterium]|nr:arginine transport system substrate-binding protein [Magnetococcales bacterium]HIJ83009.1 amino acid ABC transporter substrate-binding protein [Magnetococcales bacterium]